MTREVTPTPRVDDDDAAYAPVAGLHTDRDPLEPGDCFGPYRIVAQLGEGGASIVYLARDPGLDRQVALKILRASSNENSRLRMLREAQAMARVCHPNVVTVHRVGTIDDHVFLAMEYIEGGTLRDWLFSDERTWRHIVEVMLAAGRGLAAAHQAGLVHRDFKPDNVLVGNDGRVCVTDFGLVVPADDDRLAESPATDLYSDRLTNTGAVVGTPPYMSPEQHAEKPVGPASDQFSFCVALYEALYDELPFEGGSDLAMAYNAVHGHLRNPPADPAPLRVRRALRRGLSPSPARRYSAMNALLEQLERALTWRRRRFAFGTGGPY